MADALVPIVRMWQGGVLLMDEFDECPLRYETMPDVHLHIHGFSGTDGARTFLYDESSTRAPRAIKRRSRNTMVVVFPVPGMPSSRE